MASRFRLVMSAALLAGSVFFPPFAQAAPEPPIGTWHVLVHYKRADSPHPSRWLWEERIWVIEPSPDGLTWIEHAMVAFDDESGRFENLGTNMARRLIGAWMPNESQQRELATGVRVDSRGVRSKRLTAVGNSRWRSETEAGLVGRSAGGVGYHEVWSIAWEAGRLVFEMGATFEVAEGSESAGTTVYRLNPRRLDDWGVYSQGPERTGRARMVATRIRLAEPEGEAVLPVPTQSDSIELVPDHRINSDVPILVSVLRPEHYWGDRRVTIDSSPPDAELDIAYTRRGGQLLYRRGRAPLEVVLPTRLQADESDRLLVRGFLPGHERTRHSLSVHGDTEHLLLDLSPLPNQLQGVSHGHLAGRSILELRSAEPPTIRVARDDAGFSVVLVRTGLAEPMSRRLAALADPQLDISGRQLGDDLVLRLKTRHSDLDLRHLRVSDPGGLDFRTRLEVTRPHDQRIAHLHAAVEALDRDDIGRCAMAFETALRTGLTDRALARTLGRDDHSENPTLRAALRRFATLAGDRGVHTRAGETLTVDTPLEFELAWSRSAEIEGYLAWIEALAARIDPAGNGALAFRSLVAPEWSPERFEELLADARAARARCTRQLRVDATSPDRG